MSDLVSIIMPVYNAERYVSLAIESILAQTYYNWELIIVDDGSTDKSFEIAQSYQNDRIKIYKTENHGQCAANNYGYSKANGSYFKFFDADDLLSPKLIQAQMTILNSSKTKISSCGWGRFYNDDLSTFKLSEEECWKTMLPIDWICSSWKNGEPMMQCALWLIPKKVIEKSGLWNEKLTLINDFEFFTRVILASEAVVFAEDALLKYRSGLKNSLSGRASNEAVSSAVLSAQLAIQTLLAKENNNLTREVAANCLMNLVYQYGVDFPILLKLIVQQIDQLGGSTLKYRGGKFTNLLTALFGWKFARRLQLLFR
ncbi:GT2 family glycosyltransferase [Flavobacterium sp. W4I14]|nr:GT2 family glycosyltransferase [Flavobacterium sp. W4I14]